MVKALSQLDKAKKDLVKYNQKYAGVVETKLMKLEYERIQRNKASAERRLSNVEYYRKNKKKFEKKIDEIMGIIDKGIKREVISIDKAKKGDKSWAVYEFIKNKKGEYVRIPNKALTFARNQRDTRAPGQSLSTRSQRAQVKNATRREVASLCSCL